MTANRPSTLLMTSFLAIAALVFLVAASPLLHAAGQIFS
jgi:hypothetical protein